MKTSGNNESHDYFPVKATSKHSDLQCGNTRPSSGKDIIWEMLWMIIYT